MPITIFELCPNEIFCITYLHPFFSFFFLLCSALILFSVCGLLAVTGSWLMSGLYLSSSVAVGDLCTDPAGYLVSQAPPDLPTEVLLYYTQCESVRSNPFTLRLRESQNAINNARSAMNIVSRYFIFSGIIFWLIEFYMQHFFRCFHASFFCP